MNIVDAVMLESGPELTAAFELIFMRFRFQDRRKTKLNIFVLTRRENIGIEMNANT